MAKINVKTAQPVIPMIYAYTTPGIVYHDGWTKIGYTERDVDLRIKEQTQTANIIAKKEWQDIAIFFDGKTRFTDKEFHAYLSKNDIERKEPQPDSEGCPEWFKISGEQSHYLFFKFRSDMGILQSLNAIPYNLRNEQKQAVTKTCDYFLANDNAEYLWNAKPRFGKTLSAYDLCIKLKAEKVLIVTNRPAIANSWYDDYVKFLGTQSNYYFVSNVDALKEKKYVLSRDKYQKYVLDTAEPKGCIEFVSLQDLKGSIHFGGYFDKLGEVAELEWDVLIIDEAHEGVDTYKTDIAFDKIKRKFTLHLSGTPFKALANEKFPESAIFNWTYADEQEAKKNWDAACEEENPYANLPQLNLFTYKMSDIVLDRAIQGADFNEDGENEAFCWDFNEFFVTNASGNFVHDKEVDRFLDALTTQEKFPFSTEELRSELNHTLWLLKYVSSAKALARKLNAHPVFGKNYKVVLAAGDGKVDNEGNFTDKNDEPIKKSYDKVVDAIKNNAKTITISVGQLTTGITIPEWTAVMMLSNVKSPALYMQAAFRAQNPCLFNINGEQFRKKNCYVFDFDPARTLTIVEEFANDLLADTANGKGDSDMRKQNVRELLNFFPVYAEDADGEMIELDAEKVLSIPRAIHAKEVVRRGFMSNFLFQNIGNIFNAPQEVLDIIQKFEPVNEPVGVNPETKGDLNIDDSGNVSIPNETVIGIASDIFGEKLYGEIADELVSVVEDIQAETQNKPKSKKDEMLDRLLDAFHTGITDSLVQTASENYGGELSRSTQQSLIRKINSTADTFVKKQYGDLQIKANTLENERKKAKDAAISSGELGTVADIDRHFDEKKKAIQSEFLENIQEQVKTVIDNAGKTIVEAVETDKQEKKKNEIEDNIRNHLRGFSRTIPSFIMAYGDENTTLENFDKIIPDEVFKEVTSISLDEFRQLRDGFDFDDENGNTQHYNGFFDSVVFDDSIKEFLRLKVKLANYFEDEQTEDIFDYIPPQKTNQIFTPKKVVRKMVDALETENPGCFDNPDNTFADLYMKSGLYITEIVKRLFRSEKMKSLYPDEAERLNHIFAKQVYGCAPTEIIYRIAMAFILGFSDEIEIRGNNLRMLDTLPYAQNGTLEQKLDEIFNK